MGGEGEEDENQNIEDDGDADDEDGGDDQNTGSVEHQLVLQPEVAVNCY